VGIVPGTTETTAATRRHPSPLEIASAPASLIAKSSKLANVEPDTRASLPDFLSTLVAREDGFEERFPDIFEKRRSKI
jgi:hypothetical protein